MTSLYQPLEGLGVHWVFQASVVAAILLALAAMSVKRRLATEDGGVVPDEGVTLRNVIEVMLFQLAELSQDIMGSEWRKHFPLVGTIFLFILVSNLMGLVPWLGGSTSNANATFAWAIISYGYYNILGIKTHGWKYVYHLMGPVIWTPTIGGQEWHVRLLAPFFLPLEIILHAARIVTLGIRLLANMFADHTVVLVWLGLVPLGIPALFLGLGVLVSFLQAVVFALLTMIYIGEALHEAH
ncbi:MAG: F0F1 ATP synthase subunit A [Myxococcota bacterium]|jgi:F-type H+-transporting ATPase subunit a|nr:F0F1 ATP synthase subunit A [Myxococcota bacterium]